MMIDPLSIITIMVASASIIAYFRLARLGITEAWLPLICVIMYIVMEIDWVVTDQDEVIGDLRNYAWSLIEIGTIGGGALTIYRLKCKCRELEFYIKKALNEDLEGESDD